MSQLANAGDLDLTPSPGRSHMPQGNLARVPQLLGRLSRADALAQEKPLHEEFRAMQLESSAH